MQRSRGAQQTAFVRFDVCGRQRANFRQRNTGLFQGATDGRANGTSGHAAPAPDPDDEALPCLRGRADDRLGTEDMTRFLRKFVGAAFVSAQQAHGKTRADIHDHDRRVALLVMSVRRDGSNHDATGHHVDQAAVLLENFRRQMDDACERMPPFLVRGAVRQCSLLVDEQIRVAPCHCQARSDADPFRRKGDDGALHGWRSTRLPVPSRQP